MLWKIIIGNQKNTAATRTRFRGEKNGKMMREIKKNNESAHLEPTCFERYLDIPTFIRQGRSLTTDPRLSGIS